MFDFIECESCKSKPGMPTLCPSCLENRSAIESANSEIREMRAKIKALESELDFEKRHAYRLVDDISSIVGLAIKKIN